MKPFEESSNNGLLRIQNEINEVKKREIELQHEHDTLVHPQNSTISSISRSDSNEHERSLSPQNISPKDHFKKNKIVEPHPKPQLLTPSALVRTHSQPQIFFSPVKINSPHRGIMARFIASRGKFNVSQTKAQPVNYRNNLASIEFNSNSIKAFENLEKMEKVPIRRDTKGKPIRKGYIPVEEKIQSELRDLKNRENELKWLHQTKTDQIVPTSYDDSSEQQTWRPLNGKFSQSIDVLNNYNPPPIEPSMPAMRPAMSLATLCDLDSESEAPSSHKLIERWETIIQKNQQREKSYNLH